MSGHTYKVGNNLCANVTGSPLDYGWKEMKSFSEVLEEEPWTKAKEAAAAAKQLESQRRGRRPGTGGEGEGRRDSGGPTGGFSYDAGGRQGFGYGLKEGGIASL